MLCSSVFFSCCSRAAAAARATGDVPCRCSCALGRCLHKSPLLCFVFLLLLLISFMSSVPRGPRPRKNYAEYLNLYYLLDVQRDDEGISSDEQHFITVHQIFELWFKLVLRELTEARDMLGAG